MMRHFTFHQTWFSLLQFTHKVPEVKLLILLFYHLFYNNSGKRTFQYSGTLKWDTLLSNIRSNLTSVNLSMFTEFLVITHIDGLHVYIFFCICLHAVQIYMLLYPCLFQI